MFPKLPLDLFRQVGNAAGMGAKLALISEDMRIEAQSFAAKIEYLELASSPKQCTWNYKIFIVAISFRLSHQKN